MSPTFLIQLFSWVFNLSSTVITVFFELYFNFSFSILVYLCHIFSGFFVSLLFHNLLKFNIVPLDRIMSPCNNVGPSGNLPIPHAVTVTGVTLTYSENTMIHCPHCV